MNSTSMLISVAEGGLDGLPYCDVRCVLIGGIACSLLINAAVLIVHVASMISCSLAMQR